MALVQLTSEAREDLRDLDGSARTIVGKGLKKLQQSPELRGKPLGNKNGSGNLTNFRSLVVGDKQYRIIFQVESDGTVVVVWVIAARSEDKCYDLAVARLDTMPDRQAAREVKALVTEMWSK